MGFGKFLLLLLAVLVGLLPEPVQAATGDINTIVGAGAGGATLVTPNGLAVDGAGNVFIADTGQNRVLKLAAGAGSVTVVAGTGTASFSGDGGLATAATLNSPRAVALDGAGNIYIADTNNRRIRKVASGTGIISTVAGNGTKAISGDGGAATAASLNIPQGLALDGAGNLYIADFFGTGVRKVAASTGIITTVASSISGPTGIAVDSAGNLYVSSSEGNRVWKVAATNGLVSAVAGNGTLGFNSDQVPATTANLALPSGVALDGAGNLYITELHSLASRVRKVNAVTGILSTVGGVGAAGFSGDGGAATSAALANPKGVAVDAAGHLYVADTTNNRIRKITAQTLPVVTATPGGGTYSSAQNVVLSSDKPATIYYTTDGSEPNDVTSPSFTTTGEISVAVSTTLRYFAVELAGGASSFPSITEYNMVPGPPTNVVAAAGSGEATVSFTPPTFNGGSDILYYQVTSTPGNISTTGLASPITVTGLAGGTSYTFKVLAVSNNGTGAASAASNSVTPPAAGYNLTLLFAGTGAGSVNGDMSCTKGTTCAPATFSQNEVVTLIASPDANSLFSGWSGACVISGNTCTVTMSSAKSATATFSAVTPAKIQGGANYNLLSSAYAAAATGQVIQARSVEFIEPTLILGRPVVVTFRGGYDTAFSSSSGISAVKGKVLIRNGTVRWNRLVVR